MPPPIQLQATAARLIDPNSTGGLVTYNALTAATSGTEANILAGVLNMVMQWLKGFDWYDQNRWAIPTLLVLGLTTAGLLWRDELQRAVLGGLNIAAQAWQNYAALSDHPTMPPAPPPLPPIPSSAAIPKG